MKKSDSIVVEFSSWLVIHKDDIKFVDMAGDVIDGNEWLSMTKEQREECEIYDMVELQNSAIDGEYEEIEVYQNDESVFPYESFYENQQEVL